MFNIGDNVKIRNIGHVYPSFMSMASSLNAELNPADWLKYGSSKKFTGNHNTSKWTFGAIPARNDIYKIKNIDPKTSICLIENLKTNDQFLIGKMGIKITEHIILEEDLFEI